VLNKKYPDQNFPPFGTVKVREKTIFFAAEKNIKTRISLIFSHDCIVKKIAGG
jgi:hypothetical protein